MDIASSCDGLISDTVDQPDYFTRLANEVLELIFSYIRPRTLIKNVLPVCRRFHSFLTCDKLWQRKLKLHPLNIQLCEAEVNSPDVCLARTYDAVVTEQTLRKDWNIKKRYTTAPNGGCVDAIKLCKDSGRRFCLSAGPNRPTDRYNGKIRLWSVDKMNEGCTEDDSLLCEYDANKQGMVKNLAMDGTQQFAASVGNTLKLWDIGESTLRETATRSYKRGFPHLSLDGRIIACSTGGAVAADRYFLLMKKPHVFLFDIRNGLQDHQLCTLFEHQLVKSDIRNLKCPVLIHSFDSIKAGMYVSDGLIHCSAIRGEVSVFQESNLLPCYEFQTPRFLKSVMKTRGSILALTRKSLTAYSLGSQPVQIGCFRYYRSKRTVMDTLDGDVVTGSEDGTITAWINN